MERIILFEPEIGGHRLLHIYSLAKYWIDERLPGSLFILVSREFIEEYSDLISELELDLRSGVELIAMTPEENEFIKSPTSLGIRSINQLKILCRYAESLQATKCFAMFLDPLQFPLALGLFRNCNCKLSGIYFHPNFHYGEFCELEPTLKEIITQTRKKILLALAMRHPKLDKIFSLDPYAVSHIRKLYWRTQVFHLPEPVVIFDDRLESELWDQFLIEENRKVFLVFGVIKRKKGIFELLDAVQYLQPDATEKICILFVGSIDSIDRENFLERVAQVKRDTLVQIIVHDEFIPEQEIQRIFKLSDVIMAIYPAHVGSSGIIVQAAAAQKPILASQYGLLGELVRRNKFGLTIDASKPIDIAKAMQILLVNADGHFDPASMKEFASFNNSYNFAKTIFDNLA